MSRFAGIVYSDVFEGRWVIEPMLDVLSCKHPYDIASYKRHEIGGDSLSIGWSESKTVMAIVDGQFYRSEKYTTALKQAGCAARPSSPAELLAMIFDRLGQKSLKNLEGEFAFCLFDQENGLMVLGRDKVGKKPLYWYRDEYHFLFASELKALMVTGIIPQTVAVDGMATYLSLGYLPQDMTMIKGVNKLLPGHFLTLDKNETLLIEPYWNYCSFFQHVNPLPKEQIEKQLEDKLKKNLSEQVKTIDPSVGAFVSGGLGSASVAYLLSLQTNLLPRGVTVCFENENEADLDAAKSILDALHIPEIQKKLDYEEAIRDLVAIVWHLDEPLADPNILATWKLSSLAKQSHLQTVFSGMGSDELLVGPGRYSTDEHQISWYQALFDKGLSTLKSGLKPLAYLTKSLTLFRMIYQTKRQTDLEDYLEHDLLFNESKLRLLSPELVGFFEAPRFLHQFHELSQMPNLISSFIYFDVKTRLPDLYIHQFDRLTQAFQLDWRAPYLDSSIIECSASFPEPETVEAKDTGSYLKMMLEGVVPSEVLNRPKRTRTTFLSSWSEKMRPLFELVLKGALVDTGWIRPKEVEKMLKDPKENFRELFALLVLEIWFRLYVNRPIGKQAPKLSVEELLKES